MVNNINIPLEIFGYVGTVLIIISMLMTSLTKLRIINMCGAVISTIYSIIVGAWPIVVMNVCLLCINMMHVVKSFAQKKSLTDVKLNCSEPSLEHFFKLYGEGIKKDFPEYDFNIKGEDEAHLIYLKNKIVAFFAGKTEAEALVTDVAFILSENSGVSAKQIYTTLSSDHIKSLKIKATAQNRLKLQKQGFTESGEYMLLNLQ